MVANVLTGYLGNDALTPQDEVVAFRITTAGALDATYGTGGLLVLPEPPVEGTTLGSRDALAWPTTRSAAT